MGELCDTLIALKNIEFLRISRWDSTKWTTVAENFCLHRRFSYTCTLMIAQPKIVYSKETFLYTRNEIDEYHEVRYNIKKVGLDFYVTDAEFHDVREEGWFSGDPQFPKYSDPRGNSVVINTKILPFTEAKFMYYEQL